MGRKTEPQHRSHELTLTDRALRLVVVADTHSRPHASAAELIGALAPDAILHAGDIGSLDVLDRWHGIVDRQKAEAVYARGKTIPSKPCPCYDGIRKTMELYDSNEMRRYEAEDFYDDSILRSLDESGFIDGLYEALN